LAGEAAECQNTGVWPVLVGEPGDRSVVLGSPIILYDYPQIAPESKGDLFDGTEIDEILTLRILTLTDEEKQELRKCDERARRMLERIESAPGEDLLDLHGRSAFLPRTTDAQVAPRALHLIRGMREICAAPPAAAMVNGTELKKGDRVRLRPGKRADLFDTLLAGKIAVIEAVEQDFEGRVQFAVVLEEDPGRDLGEMRQAGHRFFYSVDEVEPVLNEAEP
jgi:hypothetical protein